MSSEKHATMILHGITVWACASLGIDFTEYCMTLPLYAAKHIKPTCLCSLLFHIVFGFFVIAVLFNVFNLIKHIVFKEAMSKKLLEREDEALVVVHNGTIKIMGCGRVVSSTAVLILNDLSKNKNSSDQSCQKNLEPTPDAAFAEQHVYPDTPHSEISQAETEVKGEEKAKEKTVL